MFVGAPAAVATNDADFQSHYEAIFRLQDNSFILSSKKNLPRPPISVHSLADNKLELDVCTFGLECQIESTNPRALFIHLRSTRANDARLLHAETALTLFRCVPKHAEQKPNIHHSVLLVELSEQLQRDQVLQYDGKLVVIFVRSGHLMRISPMSVHEQPNIIM